MISISIPKRHPAKYSRVKRKFRTRYSLLPIIVFISIVIAIFVPVYNLYAKVTRHAQTEAVPEVEEIAEVERLPLYRDLFAQETWKEVQWSTEVG